MASGLVPRAWASARSRSSAERRGAAGAEAAWQQRQEAAAGDLDTKVRRLIAVHKGGTRGPRPTTKIRLAATTPARLA